LPAWQQARPISFGGCGRVLTGLRALGIAKPCQTRQDSRAFPSLRIIPKKGPRKHRFTLSVLVRGALVKCKNSPAKAIITPFRGGRLGAIVCGGVIAPADSPCHRSRAPTRRFPRPRPGRRTLAADRQAYQPIIRFPSHCQEIFPQLVLTWDYCLQTAPSGPV
jgi:hypothetical protein